MTFTFHKLSPEDAKSQYPRYKYPRYAGEGMTYYQIFKNDEAVGLYGLIDCGMDPKTNRRQAEAFLTVFKAFRFRVFNKEFFTKLFDHAFGAGFDTIYTWTRLISWQKVFERFASLGIRQLPSPPSWDFDATKVWFVKSQGQG